MSAKYREVEIPFSNGLNNQYEASLLPQGTASVLENWVPEATGGVRVRPGWKKSTMTSGPATAKGYGLGLFSSTRRVFRQRVFDTDSADWNTTPGLITFPWTLSTRPGSTHLVKMAIHNNAGNEMVPYLETSPLSNTFGPLGSPSVNPEDGWQVLQFAGSSTTQATVLIKENVPVSQTNIKIPMTGFHPSDTQYSISIEAVELLSVDSTANFPNFIPNQWTGNGAGGSYAINIDPTATQSTGLGWHGLGNNPWGSGTFSTLAPRTGTTHLSFSHSAIAGQDELATLQETLGIPITPDTQYTASMYLRTAGASGYSIKARIKWYTAAGVLISNSDGSTITSSTTYQLMSATGTAPSNAAFASVGFFNNTDPGAASRTYYVDDVQLELGASVTAWKKGRISSVDLESILSDTSNPVNTVAGGTSTVASSFAEATLLGSDGVTTGAGASGWSNGFTEGSDIFLDGGSFESSLASSSKIITGTGQNVDTGATLADIATNQWASIVTIKLNTAEAIALDQFYISATNDATISIYDIEQADIDSGSWTLVENTALAPNGVPVAFASGLGSLVYTTTAFPFARRWSGLGETPTALTPEAGTCTAFFKSRFFVGGNPTNPTRLTYSDIGSYSSWPATNFLEIGQDDGYTVLDIASQQTYLIIAKGNSIYTLSGSGPDTFYLLQLPFGEAAPGRSICITPAGAIVAGTSAVWNVIASTVENISKPLGASYAPTGYVFTAYADDKAYILDVNAKVFWVYDITAQAWHKENFVSNNNQPVALLGVNNKRLLASPTASTDTGLILYKDLPTSSRVRDFSPLTSRTKLSSPVMHLAGPRSVMTPRYLFLQIRQRGTSPDQLTLTVKYDESSGDTQKIKLRPSSMSYRERLDLGAKKGVSSVQFELEGPESGNQFDIESALIGYDEETVR